MSRHYSDPSRADDKWTLPDVEVFYFNGEGRSMPCMVDGDGSVSEAGWYWWTCLPGCMPDSDPFGPYPTEQAAVEAAQDMD